MSRASVLAVDGRPRVVSVLPQARLERLFAERHSLVWRTLRRLGLSPAEAADTTRRVFEEAAKELGDALRSQERARLLALALRYAFCIDRFAVSEVRLRPPMARRPARSGVFRQASSPAHAACVDLMDRVLSHMARPEATAFILYELEGLSLAEVGAVMGLAEEAARQTVLHARAEFKSIVPALRAAPRAAQKVAPPQTSAQPIRREPAPRGPLPPSPRGPAPREPSPRGPAPRDPAPRGPSPLRRR
jgi:RNA polymerase sigma-70 factor, ECF subfamily